MAKEQEKPGATRPLAAAVEKVISSSIEPFCSAARVRQIRDHFALELELEFSDDDLKVVPLFHSEKAGHSAYRLNVIAPTGKVSRSFFVKVRERYRRGTLQQVLARLLDEPVKVVEIVPPLN